ncbi:restriction endonuclease subunit S [Roseovarius sp. D22-M7]|uniref:restriction endonuclease subunit S n=1 Tax=Roseovarius sp. D22-M7 TaxID=3127116 RepID=UPI00300FFDF7
MSDQAEKGEWPSTTLPESWLWASFKDTWSDSTNSTRKLKQKEYLTEGPLPVVDQGEGLVGGFTDRNDLKNDVALPCIVFGDHTRAVKFIDFEFAQGADGVKVLQPNDQYDPEFAYQALRCVRLPNKGYSRHFKFLKSTAFPIPPLPEQRRIVAKLDRLSARSAAARDHLARITKLAIRAKQAITRQLIRERQWETAQFLDVCDAYQPKTISKAQMQADGKYPVFGANGKIGFYDEFNHEHRELLVTCRGATCGAVNISEPFSWINGNAMVIKGKADHFTLDFLRAYFSHGFDFSTVISGSAQPQITRQSLAKLRMPIVPMEEQEEIVRRIEAAFARIDRMTEEASRAAQLIDRLDERLLAKAFRGELVPQDPEDEPAEALLTRIRDARAAAPKAKRGRRKKAEA